MTADDWLIEGDPLVLIACSGRKLDHAAPARELYTGDLFRASVAWAESWDLGWCVLSAKHGIVTPDRVLAPYNDTLPARIPWPFVEAVAEQLDLIDHEPNVIVLGGERYVTLAKAAARCSRVWAPLQQLEQRGIGHYRHWLATNTRQQLEVTAGVR